MIRPIYVYGHTVLRKKATDIKKDGSIDVKELANDMFETMYSASGVGLAGPQIGLGKRIFVVDGGAMDEDLHDFKKVFINAEILEEEGEEWTFEEGCLSIPQIRGEVSRSQTSELNIMTKIGNFTKNLLMELLPELFSTNTTTLKAFCLLIILLHSENNF